MPIRTLIVDDEPLARGRMRRLLEKEEDVEIVGEAADGRSAVEAIREHAPALVFLDVQMPELDGFGVLKELDREEWPCVVFVTAHDQFALRAFEVHALDYLLKPFDTDRFRQTLQRAREAVEKRNAAPAQTQLAELLAGLTALNPTNSDRIAVKSSGRIVLVKVPDIDWVESADNYVKLHVGKTEHLHRETLTAMEARLNARDFVRISRSCLVNVERIRELQPLFHGDYAVILHDGTRLTLSRSHRAKLDLLKST